MNDMEPQSNNLMPPGQVDHEGAMAKADLFKLANYSVKLFKKIDDNDQLESWVQAKITKAADYVASVYHYLEYEMKFSEFGAKLENSEMYSESEKLELKNKLNEAREMLRTLKLAQAQKLEEAKSPKAKKDWDKDGKIESEKDEVIGSRRKAAGLDESQDDDEDDDDSGYDRDDPKHPTWAERQREKADHARKEKKEKDVSESWDDDDEDPDVKRADSELKKRGVKLPKVKDKEVPIKKTKKDRDEEALDEVYGQGVYESWDDDDEDDDVKRADSELKKRGVKLPKVKHKEIPVKKTAKDKEEEKLDELSHATLKSYADKKGDQMFKDKKPASGNDLTNYRKAIDKMHKKEDDGEVNEGSGPYQLSDPKHPKFKANYEKFKKANPDKKLSDFVAAMAKKEKAGGLGEGKKPDFLDLDKDGNKKEPMKKAAKEKKCDETYKYMQDRDERKLPDRSPALKVSGKGHDAIDDDNRSRDYANSWLDDDDAVRGMKELEKVSKKKESKKESMNESAELDRLKEFLTRLNG